MSEYRKKPVTIEAIEWTGDPREVHEFLDEDERLDVRLLGDKLLVDTLEGEMTGGLGDYLVRGVEGELYPVKASIFHKTYEVVELRRGEADRAGVNALSCADERVGDVPGERWYRVRGPCRRRRHPGADALG